MSSDPLERILGALDARDLSYKRNYDGTYMAQCPAHDDRLPSLHITPEPVTGNVLIYCHADCPSERVLDALNIEMKELYADELPVERKEVARYPYVDENGEVLYYVVRFEPKDFRQCLPNGTWKLGSTRRVLYRLPEVIAGVKAGKVIHVVEGEKDADAIRARGKIATCNPGGAGKWRPEYSEVLRGAKVAVIQDNDKPNKDGKRPGEEHAKQVVESLQGIAAAVKHMRPPHHKDVGEHLAVDLPLSALVDINDAPKFKILTARQMMALPTLGVEGQLLGPMLYRGHRIVVGGHTGHGKTTFTLTMVAAAVYGKSFLDWTGKGGLKALVVDVEQGNGTIQRQLTETGLMDSDQVSYWHVPDGLAFDSDPEAIAFMEAALQREHYDIVLADPLYKMHRGDPNDSIAATALMCRFDEWRTRFGFTLVLPMHCRKPHPNSPLSHHDLFGSSAYQWGAETLIGVERKKDGCTHLHWWKDREGELGTIGTHWPLFYKRGSGFFKMDNEKKERFDLPKHLYELIRDEDGLTREEMRNRLWQEKRPHSMQQIDRALMKTAEWGVTHNGAKQKKDRIFSLPLELPGSVPDYQGAGVA